MNQLNQVTQQNASSSEELASTAEEMSTQAEQLQQAMSFFRLDASDQASNATLGKSSQASSVSRAVARAARAVPQKTFLKSAGPDESEFTRF